jgi:zinc protease
MRFVSKYVGWFGLITCAAAGVGSQAAAQDLEVDPRVTIGTLDNGVRYYVRENARPEHRAELRLVVNAGSVLEDADQLGLAHFAEHMAFNGTRRFPKQALIEYMERIGMRFGAHLNASTSFDETVYRLTVPTDSAEIVRTAFAILEDWAHEVSFDSVEIENERGVVLEEWRLGRGAQARMLDEQFPVLFHGSRYATRLPIGDPDVLRTFDHGALTRFYETWYRPDLMAVVAVGDFDRDTIVELIRNHFSGIPARPEAPPRPTYDVPGNVEPLVSVATDPEETGTSISVFYKHAPSGSGTTAAYRQSMVERLYTNMLNARLFEISERPDAPFLFANSFKGRFVRSVDAYVLGAGVAEGDMLDGLGALLTEAGRVERHGFTESEFGRQKTRVLRNMEQAYAERDKTNSSRYATQYTLNFLEAYPIPGIAREYALYQQFLPDITLAEVDSLAHRYLTEQNRVVLGNAPERDPPVVPGEQALLAIFADVERRAIAPYEDNVAGAVLLADLPQPGTVASQRHLPDIDVTEWRLGNGMRVLLKPTDFQDDEVVFRAWSPGGTSLVTDRRYESAATAATLISASGVGEFTRVDLQKVLAGKAASVFPEVNDVAEGMRGWASPQDLETMFQLIYLYFTEPRADSSAFETYRQRMIEFLRNRDADPMVAFYDTLTVVLTQGHRRARPFTIDRLEEIDLTDALAFYEDRFADASDFTFAFVGSFNLEDIRPLVTQYLGSLPSLEREETWRDVGLDYASGVVKRTVRKGLEPKAETRIVFTGELDYGRQNRYALSSMRDVLEVWLRESLRERLGGTYGVTLAVTTERYPSPRYQVTVHFASAPDRVEELLGAVFHQIDSLQTVGPSGNDVAKVKETQRRGRETALRQNGFWAAQLIDRVQFGLPLEDILTFDNLVQGLTADAIRDAARRHLRDERYVQVTLYPEGWPDASPSRE